MTARFALILLSSSGLCISAYFLLVKYRVIGADHPFIPRFCRIDEKGCLTILDSAEGNILGIPNAAIGIAYYLLILSASTIDAIDFPVSFARWVFLISVAASISGISLAYTLVRTMKTKCILCFTSHCINIIISAILFDNL